MLFFGRRKSEFGRLIKAVDNLAALQRRYLEVILADLTKLREAVARDADLDNSMITLLNGIAEKLKEANANNDQAAIDQIVSELNANSDKIAGEVAANTPAQPASPAATDAVTAGEVPTTPAAEAAAEAGPVAAGSAPDAVAAAVVESPNIDTGAAVAPVITDTPSDPAAPARE